MLLRAHVLEVRPGHAHFAALLRLAENQQLLRVRERQCIQKHSLNHAVHGRSGTHSQSERKNRGSRKGRRVAKTTKRVTKILKNSHPKPPKVFSQTVDIRHLESQRCEQVITSKSLPIGTPRMAETVKSKTEVSGSEH